MEKYYDLRIPVTGPDFERLARIVCSREFGVPFTFYGRNGQSQNGIDLYSNNFEICIQCKNYQGKDAHKRLLEEFEKDFIAANYKFGGNMKKYVLATTAQRDTSIQDKVEAMRSAYSPNIQVIFWEDFQDIFRRYPDIIDEYNSQQSIPCIDKDEQRTFYIKRTGTNVCLDESSTEILRELCKSFQSHQRRHIQIELKIQDFKDLSVLLLRDDLLRSHGTEFANFEADQSLRINYFTKKQSLEIAIENMLQDEMLDSEAILLQNKYIEKNGTKNCFYFDDNGIQRGYWTFFLWIDVIDELLKELLFSRYEKYANEPGTTSIDCWIETKRGKTIWQFISFFSNNLSGEKNAQMIKKLAWRDCDYFDIHPEERTKHLYPDLYYNIGRLKVKDRQKYESLISQYKNIFCLFYFRFGIH